MNALHLFVYGTLKRGYANHDRYCLTTISCEAAEVAGELYLHPSGYPLLRVADPGDCPLGSGDHAYDVARLEAMNEAFAARSQAMSRPAPGRCVRGELLTISEGASALPGLDRLEWFRPEAERLTSSEYWRVILPVFPLDGSPARLAWTYVLPPAASVDRLTLIPSGEWGGDAHTASDR